MIQAFEAGVLGSRATMYVDTALLGWCKSSSGVRNLLRIMGVDELTIISPAWPFGRTIKAYWRRVYMFVKQLIAESEAPVVVRAWGDVEEAFDALSSALEGTILSVRGGDEEDWMSLEYLPERGYYLSMMRAPETAEFILLDLDRPAEMFEHPVMGPVPEAFYVPERMARSALKRFVESGEREATLKWGNPVLVASWVERRKAYPPLQS